MPSPSFSCDLYLKMEQQQFSGSFKERGGRNALLSLPAESRAQGVIAASAGSHLPSQRGMGDDHRQPRSLDTKAASGGCLGIDATQ